MDINDNQQINSFVKGMNTDVSDSLIDSSQYRYAENLRLITNTDSNSGELRLIEGTLPFSTDSIPSDWKHIIAMTSIRDYLVVIVQEIFEMEKTIAIYRCDTSQEQVEWVRVVRNLWYDDFVQPGQTEPHLSLVTRWESENNVKLYIADGVHSIISLNIMEDYGQDWYETTDAVLSYSSANLSSPIVQRQVDPQSSLQAARVQYAYRLYNVGEPASQISPLSKIVSLYKGNNEGYESEAMTDNSVQITIDTDPAFEKIQIYRISYVILGQDPKVDIIYDGNNLSSFIDKGGSVEDMTAEEFLSQMELQLVPAVIESKGDYLFAANISYKQDEFDKALDDLNLDFRSYSLGDFEATPAQDDYSDAREYNKQYSEQNRTMPMRYVFDCWRKPWGETQYVLGGTGPIISWKYTIKRVLFDENNTAYVSNSNFSNLSDITESVDATPTLKHGEVYRYGIVLYNSDGVRSSVKWIADIMIPTDDMDYYDSGHNYFSTATERPDNPSGYNDRYRGLSGDTSIPNKSGWMFNTIGIRFTVNETVLQDAGCYGYEIVRCIHSMSDRYTISQGIISIPERIYKFSVNNELKKTQIIHPTPFFTTENVSGNSTYRISNQSRYDANYLQFASPEYSYQADDIKEIVSSQSSNIYVKYVQMYCNIAENPSAYTITFLDGDDPQYIGNYATLASVRDENGTIKFSNKHSMILYMSDQGGTNPRIGRLDRYALRLNSMDRGDGFGFIQSRTTTQNPYYETGINNVVAEKSLPAFSSQLYNSIKIKGAAFPKVPGPREYFDPDTKEGKYRDAIEGIGTSFYNSWSTVSDLSRDESQTTDADTYDIYADDDGRDSSSGDAIGGGQAGIGTDPVSSTGKCIVFELNSEYPVFAGANAQDNNPWGLNPSYVLAPITVSNIVKRANPYGGPQTGKSGSSDYVSHGYFKKVQGWLQYMDVFDGDAFPGVFVYNAAHCFDNSILIRKNKVASIYYVPIESYIDLRATFGDLYTRVKNKEHSYYIQDEADAVAGNIEGYYQEKDAYMYNTAYGSDSDTVSYSSIQYEDIDSAKYDVRVHHSKKKEINEHIDNWTDFQGTNYIDVDSRYGSITNMRLFKDKLLFWQHNAVGILTVNDRSLVQDMDGNKIILGTADMLSRFDYISTMYGMKPNQYEAEIQSNTTQYWWDGYRREILAYADGAALMPLTKSKSLTNYINTHEDTERPCLMYDSKYNELLANVVNNECLTYNEQVEAFTSIYTLSPLCRAIINDNIYMTPDKTIHKWFISGSRENASVFGSNIFPKLKYIVNRQSMYNKTFDISTFGGRFYGGSNILSANDNTKHLIKNEHWNTPLAVLSFDFKTPLKQHSTGTGSNIVTNREYDYRLNIPRNNNDSYGGRMRGKTMQCELSSSSNSTDFSLQYIITKYRMSLS